MDLGILVVLLQAVLGKSMLLTFMAVSPGPTCLLTSALQTVIPVA